MRKIITLLATIMVASTLSISQGVVEIKFNPTNLMGLVPFGGYGDLFPVDKNKSFLNAEFAQLYLLDNNTGKLIKQFDERILEKAIDSILIKKKEIKINRIDKEDHKYLPYCSSNQFTFHRFYKIPNSDLFAIQINTPLKIDGVEEPLMIYFIAFFDKNLNLISLIEIDMVKNANVSIKGGFFLDKENFFVPIKNQIPCEKFMHYQFEDGKYWMNGPIDIIYTDQLTSLRSARHFTAFKIDNNYYLHNGKKLIGSSDIYGECNSEINIPLREKELMVDLKKINTNQLIGIKIDKYNKEKEDTKWQRVVLTNLNFYKIDLLKKYHSDQFVIRSMETLGNRAYLLLFHYAKKKYLLDVIEID